MFKSLRTPIKFVRYNPIRQFQTTRVHYDLNPQRLKLYQQFFQPKKSTKNIQRVLIGLSITGYILWYIYWPHHTFSKTVAKILRKGLWAESYKENFNYSKALDYYKEALNLAIEEELDELTDEFTGIEIKIGEMLEILGKEDEAKILYERMIKKYFTKINELTDETNPQVEHYFQKNLRVILKYSSLFEKSNQFVENLLLTQLLVINKYLKIDNESTNLFEIISKNFTLIEKNDTFSFKSNDNKFDISLFKDEYFDSNEVLISIYLTNQKNLKITKKLLTNLLKLNLFNNGNLTFFLNNLNLLGSLNYFEFENQADILEKTKSLDYSLNCYKLTVKLLNEMFRRNPNLKENPELMSIYSLSCYSIGVINLDIKDYKNSRKFLLLAKNWGEKFQFEELVDNCETELRKIENST